MAIYSPSQTKSWLTCPVKRSLEQEGWTPRSLGRGRLAGILGTAFAAGVAIYHQALKEGAPCDVAAVQQTGMSCAREELKKYESMGCVVRSEDEPTRDGLEKRVALALKGYMDWGGIEGELSEYGSWEILHVEHVLESYGNSRIDLGVRTPLGLAIADVKVKLSLDQRYYRKTRDQYATDWQMRHYVWAYSQYMGQPVREYYIILVVLEPKFSVEVIPYSVTDEDMLAWEASALHAWASMEDEGDGLTVSIQNLTSCWTSFGPCDYLKACHTFHYDEALMKTEYVLRDPLPMPQPMPLPKPFEPMYEG